MEPTTYWPFWIGGAGLAAVSVLHLIWVGRPLGISGELARLLRLRADERERRAEERLAQGELDAALLAATLARFGDAMPPDIPAAGGADTAHSTPPRRSDARLPVDCVALVLAGLALGAAIARWMAISPDAGAAPTGLGLGDTFARLAGSDLRGAAQLVAGGLLVGFGARMAGGCTSGHGLVGLASLRPASALATAAMFAGGIAVSFWLERA